MKYHDLIYTLLSGASSVEFFSAAETQCQATSNAVVTSEVGGAHDFIRQTRPMLFGRHWFGFAWPKYSNRYKRIWGLPNGIRTRLSFSTSTCAGLLIAALACSGPYPVMAQSPARGAPENFPSGPGSLSGVWLKSNLRSDGDSTVASSDQVKNTLVTADGSQVPLQPWAQTLVDKRLKDAEAGRIYASNQTKCLPAGVPEMMLEAGPMEFVETPTQFIILRQEFTFFRIVRMNAEHLKDFDPTFLGDSVGHWERDTLVVDTIGQNDSTTIRKFIPHSEAMHVIERYRRTGPDTLEIAVTVDDPKTFTKAWRMVGKLKRQTYDLTEFFCVNNRNVPDENGNLVVAPVK